MTREEIIEGLKLLEDNMVYFDELLNDKGEYIDVHELLFEAIEVLEQEPCNNCDYKEWLKGEIEQEPCADCISRAELIDKTIKRNSIWLKITDSRGMNLQEIIDELPSVQPTAKENLVVEDCISRDSLKHKLQEHHDFFVNAYGGFSNLPQNDKSRVDEITNCIAMVVNEPPVTPKPKTGHWMKQDLGYRCSYCTLCTNEKGRLTYNYCPNCGAKMESEE